MGAFSATVPKAQVSHDMAWIKNVKHTLHECQNALVVLESLLLLDEIHLVLEDDDVLELHDLDGGQVLRCLGLRAGFVTGNKQQCSVHDCGAVKHSSHQNVVSGAIDERDVSDELHSVAASRTFARRVVLLVRSV